MCKYYFSILLICVVKKVLGFENNYEHEHDKANNYKFDYSAPHDGEDYLKKLNEVKFGCLKTKGKLSDSKILNMTIEEKLEAFKQSECAPVVVLPGFMGSKMEFRMKDCKEFEKFHLNIMKSCGWKNCRDPRLKKFPIWVNTDFDVMEVLGVVMGGDQNSKKKKVNKISKNPYIPHLIKNLVVNENVIEYEHQEECFGSIFRLYYAKNSTDGENTSYQLTNLKGAEVRVKDSNKKQCGLDVVSNYLGQWFSVSRNFQGFAKLDEYFLRMGYTRGVSLFYHPYDFRLPLDMLIRRLGNTVRTAYKITKKKPIIIGHSLGGLIAYKFSLQENNSDLIDQVVTIGTPFLGAFHAVDNLVMKKNLIDTEKSFNIYGYDVKLKAKLDERSIRILFGTLNQLHFIPKHIIDDEVDKEIINISEIEKIESEGEFMNRLSKMSDFSKYFYEIFPQPSSKCYSVARKNIHVKNTLFSPICKLNYNDLNSKPILNKNGEDFTVGKNFNPEFKNTYKKIWSEDIKMINKNIHDIFHIEADSFMDHIFDNQEKEVFSFKQPKVPFTFVYSHHIDTPVKIKYEKNGQPKMEFSSGDGTVGGFSQIYPGLRWLNQNFENKLETPTHFVEYCAVNKGKSVKTYDPRKSQYISLSCDF